MGAVAMKRLDCDTDGGALDAYEVPVEAEQVGNWLGTEVGGALGEALSSAIREDCSVAAILKSLRVDDERRGEGLGSELMDRFLDQVSADVILLVADAHESQAEGFSLRGWYEDYGFAVVAETNAGPLMVYPEEVAERLVEVVRNLREAAGPGLP